MLLLIKQVFDKVLVAKPAAGPIPLLRGRSSAIRSIWPGSFRWSTTHPAIVAWRSWRFFFIKGVCDYIGNYLVSSAGYSSVTDLRNAVFDKVLKQSAEFFEAHSTAS